MRWDGRAHEPQEMLLATTTFHGGEMTWLAVGSRYCATRPHAVAGGAVSVGGGSGGSGGRQRWEQRLA